MIKAIFFDVDDTMYDHLYPFKRAVSDAVAHSEAFPYEAAYHRMRYYSDKLSVQYGGAELMAQQGIDSKMQAERFMFTLADFNIPVTFEEAELIQQAYLDTQFNISLFPKIDGLIEQLKKQHYIVGLLTNGAKHHQSKKISALKLDQIIDPSHIFISGEFGKDKPDPAIFHHICECLTLPAELCLYVGDSWRNDVIGATHAGWKVLWFNHRQQPYPETDLKVKQVNSIEELIHYFETLF